MTRTPAPHSFREHPALADLVLNFDPSAPQERYRALIGAEAVSPEAALPRPVPWPAGAAPMAAPQVPAPAETDDLSRYAGYDAVVVTWTAAEAAALATLFTPAHPVSSWYEYRHDVASYIPLVTGNRAPFNATGADQARYRHSLGLCFPCTIGAKRVLLFKSGLHLAYDGPAVPVRRLMTEIAQTVRPGMFITTGTGGGIGTEVKLGDVVAGGTVRFDCHAQFKAEPWATASYAATPLSAAALALLTPALTGVNASRIPGARPAPEVFATEADAIVTTDVFAFDDSTDHYGLQGLGQACELGDAMVAQALSAFPAITFHAIRNASDPQIANPTGNIETAAKQAASIYARYGGLTTAASAIASWAAIRAG